MHFAFNLSDKVRSTTLTDVHQVPRQQMDKRKVCIMKKLNVTRSYLSD